MIRKVKNVFAQTAQISDALPFYRELLGAEPQFVDGERWTQFRHGDVTIALAGEGEALGPGGTGWVLSLEVEDLDEAIAKATAAGGRLDGRRDMGQSGATAVLEDPTGNPLVLWARAAGSSE